MIEKELQVETLASQVVTIYWTKAIYLVAFLLTLLVVTLKSEI